MSFKGFRTVERPDSVGPFGPANTSGAKQLSGAFAQFHEQGKPLSGALRIGSLLATRGDEDGMNSLYAGTMASGGRIPNFTELRALIEAGRALRPRVFLPGSVLVRKGAQPDGLYIVHIGHVSCGTDREKAGPMSVHGAVSCFTGRVTRERVTAIERVLALHLSQADAEILKSHSVGAASMLARRIYGRLLPA